MPRWNAFHDWMAFDRLDEGHGLTRAFTIGYGADVGDDTLFLQHTYLVVVAKATLDRTLGDGRAEIERLRNERAREQLRRRDRSQDRGFSM